MVDATGYYGSEPLENFRTILAELDAHTPELAAKPQLVVLNKIDAIDEATLAEARALFGERGGAAAGGGASGVRVELSPRSEPEAESVWAVSAVTGKGVTALVRHVGDLVESVGRNDGRVVGSARRPPKRATSTWSTDRPPGGGPCSPSAERTRCSSSRATPSSVWCGATTSPTTEAVRYLAERLERDGIYAALRDHGAEPGDEVDIDGFVFEYQ